MEYIESIDELFRYLAEYHNFTTIRLCWQYNGHWFTPFELIDDACTEIKEKSLLLKIISGNNYTLNIPIYNALLTAIISSEIEYLYKDVLIVSCKYLINKYVMYQLTNLLGKSVHVPLNNILHIMLENNECAIANSGLYLSSSIFNYIDSVYILSKQCTAARTITALTGICLESLIIKVIDIMQSADIKIIYNIEQNVCKTLYTNDKILQQILINLLLICNRNNQHNKTKNASENGISNTDEPCINIYVYAQEHDNADANAVDHKTINICVLNSYSDNIALFDVYLSACYALSKKIKANIFINPIANAYTISINGEC